MKKIIRLGTRGSPLALIQAQIVRETLFHASPELRDSHEIEIVPINTSGDWRPGTRDISFLEMGGSKGLFTKEIEEALLSNTIDCAVHSMKDVSVKGPEGLTFAAILERADPRDALLSPLAPTLDDLPIGARVGTSSLRRKAQLLALRPDLHVVPLRGNVDTRMKKLAAEEADATILAVAGLTRLGVIDKAASIFSPQEILPAAAQGLLGIQIREDDTTMRTILAPINHAESETCWLAERALMRRLDGSCRTPIAAYARFDEQGGLFMEALVAKVDGSAIIRRSQSAPRDQAEALGDALGREIRAAMPTDFLVFDES